MKKRLVATLLVLVMAVCVFPVCAFADYDQPQTHATSAVSKPAQTLWFKDSEGNAYSVYSGTVVSKGSSHTGYVLVIQEVLYRLSVAKENDNFNPNGIDGTFGEGTRLAVVCFQVAYISANDADGAVGPTTWWYLHNRWVYDLRSTSLTSVIQ